MSEITQNVDVSKENTPKKASKKNVGRSVAAGFLGAIAYVLVLVMTYLAISFKTNTWNRSWLIIVVGILFPIAMLLAMSAMKKGGKSKAFTVFSRIMLAFAIMIGAVLLFLFLFFIGGVEKSWIVFLLAVPAVLVADAAYAIVTKQKFAFVNYMLYIPACASLLYVVLGITGLLPWHPGWMLIVLSVIADLVIAVGKLMKGSDKTE